MKQSKNFVVVAAALHLGSVLGLETAFISAMMALAGALIALYE